MGGSMHILAHRGLLDGKTAENTLEAFEVARSAGLDGIETDVRLSADDELILYHDRNTPDGVPVATLTLSELRERAGLHVPTLEEAVEVWPDGFWDIEVKSPDVAPVLLSDLRVWQKRVNLLITSFRHDLMAHLADRVACPVGLLVSHRPHNAEALLSQWPARVQPALIWDYDALDSAITGAPAFAASEHYAYGVETCDEFRRCEDQGLVGVITDYPQRLGR